MQRRQSPDSGTYIGSGKASEIALLAMKEKANVVLFDNDLSPSQIGSLEKIINDEAVKWHNADPNRFYGAAELPVKDPQLALKELNRIAGQPGIRAVHVPNSLEESTISSSRRSSRCLRASRSSGIH